MKKIVLLCSQGASTSILVKAMEKAAAQMEYACDIHAYSINELNQVKDSADIILLGPQIRFQEAKVKQEASCKVNHRYGNVWHDGWQRCAGSCEKGDWLIWKELKPSVFKSSVLPEVRKVVIWKP